MNNKNEEEYFYRSNKELLEKRREENDKKRTEFKLAKQKDYHWMKCPKCGDKMEEENLVGILIDKCSGCNGIYFDNGELETLLEINDRKGFFTSIRKVFYN